MSAVCWLLGGQRADVLPLADQVRRDGSTDGQACDVVGEVERPVQEAAGRGGAGKGDPTEGGPPKLVYPERRRRTVDAVRRRLGHDRVSERRACMALTLRSGLCPFPLAKHLIQPPPDSLIKTEPKIPRGSKARGSYGTSWELPHHL